MSVMDLLSIGLLYCSTYIGLYKHNAQLVIYVQLNHPLASSFKFSKEVFPRHKKKKREEAI